MISHLPHFVLGLPAPQPGIAATLISSLPALASLSLVALAATGKATRAYLRCNADGQGSVKRAKLMHNPDELDLAQRTEVEKSMTAGEQGALDYCCAIAESGLTTSVTVVVGAKPCSIHETAVNTSKVDEHPNHANVTTPFVETAPSDSNATVIGMEATQEHQAKAVAKAPVKASRTVENNDILVKFGSERNFERAYWLKKKSGDNQEHLCCFPRHSKAATHNQSKDCGNDLIVEVHSIQKLTDQHRVQGKFVPFKMQKDRMQKDKISPVHFACRIIKAKLQSTEERRCEQSNRTIFVQRYKLRAEKLRLYPFDLKHANYAILRIEVTQETPAGRVTLAQLDSRRFLLKRFPCRKAPQQYPSRTVRRGRPPKAKQGSGQKEDK